MLFSVFIWINMIIQGFSCQGSNNSKEVLGIDGHRSTLTDLGTIAVKIAQSMDSTGVDLDGISELITTLSRTSVIMDNPREASTTDFKLRLDGLERKQERMKKEIDSLRHENIRIKASLSGGNHHGVDEGKISANIGFSAFVRSEQSLANGTVVKYDRIIRNDGNYYNAGFGYFACPVGGHYFVSFMYRSPEERKFNSGRGYSYSHSVFSIALKVGSTKSINAMTFYTGQSGSGLPSISGATIVHCADGHRIWAESLGNGIVYGHEDEPYTMMTVYLLNKSSG